jgi:outer membrane protein OmpA-like peptidoglycan-associated protein
MIRAVWTAFLMLFATAAFGAWNEAHVEGTREHALLKFYPQASVYEYDQKDFDSADMVTAYKKGTEVPAKTETLEGKVTKYKYSHKPNTSLLEIVRQFENALKAAGFVTIVAGKAANYPGLPEPSDNDGFGSFRLDRNGVPAVYVQVLATYNGGTDNPESYVTILEIRAMEQKLQANADTWFNEISSTGRVVIYGVNFDTGKDTLRPDSEKVLAELKKLSTSHAQLKLRIEGHTDNVGNAASNKKLSEDRALAVKAWLVKNGASEANLASAGFGDSKPLADNKTEEGRAKNRRVELVKQ